MWSACRPEAGNASAFCDERSRYYVASLHVVQCRVSGLSLGIMSAYLQYCAGLTDCVSPPDTIDKAVCSKIRF